ncbi:MAG: hypothetical protein HY748_13215 [Elusimicrobia bacterium]|nr:hypothetical protein [Elusimicrobiota bacterium]
MALRLRKLLQFLHLTPKQDEQAPAADAPPLLLDRYRHTVTRSPSPKPAPPAGGKLPGDESGPDAVLVESGSFRVDVSRLLDKLREHQLTDPHYFILCWLRCAVASGAKLIELDPVSDGLELRFDGKPFSAQELDQPYAALLDPDAPEVRRGRHFAYGLLGVQRLEPDRIEMVSGMPGSRAAMVLAGRDSVPQETPAAGLEDRTVIRLRWRKGSPGPDRHRLLTLAADSFGLAEATLVVGGREAPSNPWEAPSRKATGKWTAFSREGWRGAVCHFIPRPNELPTATAHVYVLGTRIQDFVRHQYSAFEAYLSRDDLKLDASQSRLVEDERLEVGLRTLL